jgi:ATP-dependent metalloprotease FtsH
MKFLNGRTKGGQLLRSKHWLHLLWVVPLIALVVHGILSIPAQSRVDLPAGGSKTVSSASQPCIAFRGARAQCLNESSAATASNAAFHTEPVQAESVLYAALKAVPTNISAVEYQPSGADLVVTLKDKSTYKVNVTDSEDINNIRSLALAAQPSVTFGSEHPSASGLNPFAILFFVLLFAGLLIPVLRYLKQRKPAGSGDLSSASGGNKPYDFGSAGVSTAKMPPAPGAQKPRKRVYTFTGVIGHPDAVNAARSHTRLLRNSYILQATGSVPPVAILLYGPPGTGKTSLARAIAHEAGVPFFEMAGSDFIDKYVGVGASRIREFFDKAKKSAPCVAFIDELDAFAKSRNDRESGSEESKAITALATEINDLREHGVLLVGATNMFNKLDDALVRAGRFEVRIKMGLPKLPDRKLMYKLYFENKHLAPDVDIQELARKSSSMSGASIERVCNDAALAHANLLLPLVEERLAMEVLETPELPKSAVITAKVTQRFHWSAERRAEVKASAQADTEADSVEARLDARKLQIANDLIAAGNKISQEMAMAAVDNEIATAKSKSGASRYLQGNQIKFTDVVSAEGVSELAEIVDMHAHPENYVGLKAPKGVLLYGPPGTGKTRLAQAVAGEADVPFFSVNASSLDGNLVGDGVKAVKELFEEAREHETAIIFMDEIDSIGRRRGSSTAADVSAQTLNQLLAELDGFDQNSGRVLFIAATNLIESLDPALIRPGRIDRKIPIELPDAEARKKQFELHFRLIKAQTEPDIDLEFFAQMASGLSGAAIATACNEAGLLQKRLDRAAGLPENKVPVISAEALDEAITRELMGGPKQISRTVPTFLKYNTAVHEGGHWAVHHELTGELVARITVRGWGRSAGHVQQLDNGNFMPTREDLINRICVALGGRISQQVIMNRTDIGASNDFEQARSLAYEMVTVYGMSPLNPRSAIKGVDRSEKEKSDIEEHVQLILEECTERVRLLITENRHGIDALVTALMEKETILGPEAKAIYESATASGATLVGALAEAEAVGVVESVLVGVEANTEAGPSHPAALVSGARQEVGGSTISSAHRRRGLRMPDLRLPDLRIPSLGEIIDGARRKALGDRTSEVEGTVDTA